MTPELARLQNFIRSTLGCGCPDEVLEWIQCSQSEVDDENDLRLTRIDVGGRLLVYVIEAERDPEAAVSAVSSVAASGLVERETGGFNRLRVVVATRDPDAIRPRVETRFAHSAQIDDRIHVHVVAADDLPFD